MRLRVGQTPRGGAPMAMTLGNFDGVHRGHQALLQLLKQEADARGLASLVLTFEPHPREFFTPREAPVRLTPLREKYQLIKGLGIDRVGFLRFDEKLANLTAESFVEQVLVGQCRVGLMLVGDDFRFGSKRAGDFALLESMGRRLGFDCAHLGSVVVGDERVSSSAIRAALNEGQLARAESLLGRPFSMTGRVTTGRQLGRTLGFPTLNIPLKERQPPLTGIFAVTVRGLGPVDRWGVASLGTRPTISDSGQFLLEVHLFDFDQTVYGARVEVAFLHRIRPEQRFDGLDQLTARIRQDVEEARNYFAATGEKP